MGAWSGWWLQEHLLYNYSLYSFYMLLYVNYISNLKGYIICAHRKKTPTPSFLPKAPIVTSWCVPRAAPCTQPRHTVCTCKPFHNALDDSTLKTSKLTLKHMHTHALPTHFLTFLYNVFMLKNLSSGYCCVLFLNEKNFPIKIKF